MEFGMGSRTETFVANFFDNEAVRLCGFEAVSRVMGQFPVLRSKVSVVRTLIIDSFCFVSLDLHHKSVATIVMFKGFHWRQVHVKNQRSIIVYFICTNTVMICRLEILIQLQAIPATK